MESVGRRLQSLENNISDTFDRGTDYELSECDTKLNSTLRNLEYTLSGYKIDSPSQVDRMVETLKGKLSQVKKMIGESRDNEMRDTIENLQSISIELDSAIDGLEQFEVEGIKPTGQDDIAYEENVERFVDDQIMDFVQEHGIRDEKVVEEIRQEMNGLKKTLVRTHDSVSVSMKRSIKSRVEEIGQEFIALNEKKSAEKEKQQKGDTLIDSLQSQTVSSEELAENDSKELSDNEAAFRGQEQPTTNSRQDYEAMFK